MKKVNTIFMCLFFASATFAQNFEREESYVFTKGTVIKPYNKLTSKTIENQVIAQSGWKFKIDEVLADGYIIRFLKWNSNFLGSKQEKDSDENKNLLFVNRFETVIEVTKDGSQKKVSKEVPLYFYIEREVFEKSTVIQQAKTPIVSFVTGAVTVPIKIRPGGDERDPVTDARLRQFDFANDINVGLSAGLRLRIDNKQRAFLNLVGGISLTSVSVDEESTSGFVNQKTNASSIAYSIGIVFQYDDFQIGLINGWDHLSRGLGDNWVYQGRPWYGLGLGLSIFSTKDKSNTNQ